jgi:CBS domain containing-hemolysin-like protein
MLDALQAFAATLVIATLVAVNALFVAAEFAIVAAPRLAIRRRAEAGSGAARLVEWIQRDANRQDRFIATAQLGITAASLGLGMYGERVLADGIRATLAAVEAPTWLSAHGIASAVSLAILTYLHIVLGEMVPKSIALVHPQRVALTIGPLMRGVQLALFPAIVTLNVLGNVLLRLVGIDRRGGSEHLSTPEDLAYIVRESHEGGVLREEPAAVLQELLEFGSLTAAEVMVPRVKIAGMPLGATAEEMRDILHASQHTRYPVYEEAIDRVLGMVHVKDLLRLLPRGMPLSANEVRKIPFVPETMLMDRLVATLRDSRSQMAIVMDEHGGTAGLITVEDLFEEVVGEITEDTMERAEIYRDPAGRLHVAGTVRIDDVGEELGFALTHEDVDTVSGLVLALLDRPATVGDTVVWHDVRFEVTAVAGHGVEECVVSLVPPEPAPDDEVEPEPDDETPEPEDGGGRERLRLSPPADRSDAGARMLARSGTSATRCVAALAGWLREEIGPLAPGSGRSSWT